MPSLRRRIDLDWWYDALEAVAVPVADEDEEQSPEREFANIGVFASLRSLDVTTPCCGTATSLNELDYDFPVGFGRFVLEALNPNAEGLDAAALRRLEAAAETPLRQIWTHL